MIKSLANFSVAYGTGNVWTECTWTALAKCVGNDHLVIPPGDDDRASLFGDNNRGRLKAIVVCRDGEKVEYSHSTPLRLHFSSACMVLLSQAKKEAEAAGVPMWTRDLWHPCNRMAERKLELIRANVVLYGGSLTKDYAAQQLLVESISPLASVLEIFSGVGDKSILIGSLLRCAKNLVALECDTVRSALLLVNRDANHLPFHVEHDTRFLLHASRTGGDCKKTRSGPTLEQQCLIESENGAMEARKTRSMIPTMLADHAPDSKSARVTSFDTIVSNCEKDALDRILQEAPALLNSVTTAIIKNNSDSQRTFLNDEFGFREVSTSPNVYQVWRKVHGGGDQAMGARDSQGRSAERSSSVSELLEEPEQLQEGGQQMTSPVEPRCGSPSVICNIPVQALALMDTIRYRNALPFPHLVIDRFILDDALIRQVEKEVRGLPLATWAANRHSTSQEMAFQHNKYCITDGQLLGPCTQRVLTALSSPEACSFFSLLSGIPNLEPDPDFVGGGAHRIDRGGKLSVHADFNYHPRTGKHRRLNALLYLNPTYQAEWEGRLELWDIAMTHCASSLAPLFNRLVVFSITDDAFHGHPVPWNAPEDYPRLSLAMYYYTSTRPEHEKSSFHWASWQSRPGQGY
jgi:Rps23 Pro-64 3,4-dihydroxylase Tpa1-like proline 4-hydroxylase